MNETFQLAPLWVPLVSVFIPILVAAATRSESDSRVRALIAILAAGAVAVVELVIGDGATVAELIAVFMTAVTAQFVAYKSLWGSIFDINEKVVPDKGL